MQGLHAATKETMMLPFVRFVFLLCLLVGCLPASASCAPPLTGAPCAQGGLAIMAGTEPALSLAAGNPIHIVTGNKYQQDTDLPPNPGAPGLELIRHYNAFNTAASVYGSGWTLSYDTRLVRTKTGWQIAQADGSRAVFPDSGIDSKGSHHSRYGRLDHPDSHHNWYWPSGTVLRFDSQGLLIALRWPRGDSVYIQRNASTGPLHGTIESVTNDRGQAMHFHYQAGDQRISLTSVQTHLGRFQYEHDADGRLTGVTRPDAMQRHYLYEPERQSGHAHALTGIAISSADGKQRQRVNTWEYDPLGRAVKSVQGEPQSTHGVVLLDYQQVPSEGTPGLTVVKNADGHATRFHTAIRSGRHVLTRVDGSGCSGCAATGTRADYDDAGRLVAINGTTIKRDANGAIQRLEPALTGWPGLVLGYTAEGLRDYWHSTATGTETMRYDSHGLPIERRFANGDSVDFRYDVQRRPVALTERHGKSSMATELSWHGNRLTRIVHPHETETHQHDDGGRVTQRDIRRPNLPDGSNMHYRERFAWDDLHRMTHHDLPEGGSLAYEWGHGAQLKAIYWHDINGKRHPVIETVPGLGGYRYGNGLHLGTAADSNDRVRRLELRGDTGRLFSQYIHYDTQGRPETEVVPTSDRQTRSVQRYGYDAHGRLAVVQQSDSEYGTPQDGAHPTLAVDQASTWLAWHEDGRAAAHHRNGVTIRPASQPDNSGLPLHADGYDLRYGAGRRLTSVSQDGQVLATYQHNAFGHRIFRSDSHGNHTAYYYLNNQLVAQSEFEPGQDAEAGELKPLPVTRRYVYAHHVPVAIIDYSSDLPGGVLYAVHADLQGAPRQVTDAQQRVRWAADYSPLGQAIRIRGDLRLDLRLPGQFYDPATGWHDNLLRTYMPQWGHYLEPDPLGPVPSSQAYGYANQQPRRHGDPMGLLLFAFDGTRQSADTQSNVWKMSQYYLDGPVHYHSGPGNSIYIDWDALTAHQARQIVETQWKWLLLELSRASPNDTTPIDILGFSRGAALARHFGNLISQHVDQGLFKFNDTFFGNVSACVDLRFMGLFDSVAQFGVAGSQNHNYDLGIAPAWEWVAHAIALHEHRWLFPLLSASESRSDNVVEAPFIGAHSDIGGGVQPAERGAPGGRGDLSDVALNWMIWQARAALVRFGQPDEADLTITQPIIHDLRSSLMRVVQNGDRSIQSSSGRPWMNYQDDHPRLGRNARQQTEALIRREPDWRKEAGVEVGTVDMDAYARWLSDELGWQAAPV